MREMKKEKAGGMEVKEKEKEKGRTNRQRRESLKAIGAAILASMALPLVSKGAEASPSEKGVKIPDPELPELPPPSDHEDPIITMMRDLQRALKKPIEQRKWIMVIDTRKCVGCHACTIACIAENKLPPGVVYRPVIEEEIGTYPNVRRRFIPRPCMQCEHPSCTPVSGEK